MPTKLVNYLILVLAGAFSAACGNALINNDQSNRSGEPATEVVSNAWLAQTLVAHTNYLDECKFLNPIKLTEQIPYQGILPGRTKEAEVESILGLPDKRSVFQSEINLVYGSNVGVLVQDGIVMFILASLEHESGLTLEEVILQYGCPDLILAVNTTVDQVGYNSIRFIYSTVGLAVSFPGFPTSLGERADAMRYFPTMTIPEYFEKTGWTQIRASAQPVEWNDAVK